MLAVAKVDTSPGLKLIERPVPTISGGQDVIVEVGACGICGADLQMYNSYVTHMQRMSVFGFPRIMGHEVAGTVREVGKDVVGFAAGDHVVCEPTFPCGVCFFCLRGQPNLCKVKSDRTIGVTRDGGYAKYVLVNSHQLAKVPSDMPFEEAAMFEPVGVSLHALEQSRFKAGDSAVVIGPGPLGILAAMLLQISGIRTLVVAGRRSSRERLAVAASIGAETVEIEGNNLEEKVLSLTDGLGADVVFEFAGGPEALNSAFAAVRKGGEIIVASTGPTGHVAHDTILKKELTIVGSAGRVPSTWNRTIDLIAHNAIDLRKVITHVLPLEEYDTAFQLLQNRKALKICLVPGK